jgi:predicted lipoprotein with Yx(FWY)xxD motif
MREHFWARTIAVTAVLAVGGAAITACGSDDDDDTASSAAAAGTAASASDATVEVMEIAGVGTVLADAAGQVLYASDEEAADPDVVCVDDCEQFWSPLVVAGAPPAAVSETISFDVAARPDGSQQVTFEGRRLYTFTQEGPGQASGDGFSDSFGDQPFTWHAAFVDAAATIQAPAAQPPASVATTGTAPAGYPGY